MTNATLYTLLIVEDNREMREGLRDFFEIEGYEVTVASDGEEAVEHLRKRPCFDVVLLDVRMPGKSGFDVLQEAQSLGVTSPIIMVTALGQQDDVLHGFGLGADDYVVKPFSAEVLAARVRAILNRAKPPSEAPMSVYRFGDIMINFSANEAYRGEDELHLTALEYDLLRYLIHNEGRTISRKQLIRHVWGIEGDLVTRTVDRHVASLRRKIEPDRHNPVHIHTVYGLGYRFTAKQPDHR